MRLRWLYGSMVSWNDYLIMEWPFYRLIQQYKPKILQYYEIHVFIDIISFYRTKYFVCTTLSRSVSHLLSNFLGRSAWTVGTASISYKDKSQINLLLQKLLFGITFLVIWPLLPVTFFNYRLWDENNLAMQLEWLYPRGNEEWISRPLVTQEAWVRSQLHPSVFSPLEYKVLEGSNFSMRTCRSKSVQYVPAHP